MNDFLEIGKVIFFVVLGIVTILIAGTPFLTKGMRKKYTEESVKNYCKNNCFAEIIFAMGLILEGIFQDGVIYYLGIGCLFLGAVFTVVASKKLVKK